MREKFKALNPSMLERMLEMEELVEMLAWALTFQNGFVEAGAEGVETPEWVERNVELLRETISQRQKALDTIALRKIEGQLDQEKLKVPGEYKKRLEAQQAVLQARLGLVPKTAGRGKRS